MASQAKPKNELKTKVVKKILNFGSSNSQETNVSVVTYNDGPLTIDIRKFYLNKDTNEFLPSGKGISIPLDQLEDLEKAVKRLRKWKDWKEGREIEKE